MGVTVSTKLSYPLDIKAPYFQHKILSERYDPPQRELIHYQSRIRKTEVSSLRAVSGFGNAVTNNIVLNRYV